MDQAPHLKAQVLFFRLLRFWVPILPTFSKEHHKSDLFWLTPTQLKRIQPHLPLSHSVPRVDVLRIVPGIGHVIRDGLHWRGAPRAA